jgi:hypothetical protein
MSAIKSPSLIAIIKAALQGSLIAAGLNIAWLFGVEYYLSIQNLPKGFQVAVVLATIIPILLGSVLYFLLAKNFTEGKRLFLFIGAGFTALSMFPSFQATLPDGNLVPEHWALITVPMHFIAGGIGLYYITEKFKFAG